MMLARPVQPAARPRSVGLVAMVMASCSWPGHAATRARRGRHRKRRPRIRWPSRRPVSGDAEAGVSGAQGALTSAHQNFCVAAKDYVETLDRYGRVFTDRSATVGDVQTLGADLVEPRDEVATSVDAVETAKNDLAAAQQELVDAQAALAAAIAAASSVPVSSTAETTITTTTLVPAATIERVQLAEQDLARTARGINADTPLVDAGCGLQLGRARTRDRLAEPAQRSRMPVRTAAGRCRRAARRLHHGAADRPPRGPATTRVRSTASTAPRPPPRSNSSRPTVGFR